MLRVPTTAPTVRIVFDGLAEIAAVGRHATVVPDVHADVVQAPSPSAAAAVGVKLREPKLSPLIVTDTPAEAGALPGALTLTAGASKVNDRPLRVPTTALTVTKKDKAVNVFGGRSLHATVVVDVHEAVLHRRPGPLAVGVKA